MWARDFIFLKDENDYFVSTITKSSKLLFGSAVSSRSLYITCLRIIREESLLIVFCKTPAAELVQIVYDEHKMKCRTGNVASSLDLKESNWTVITYSINVLNFTCGFVNLFSEPGSIPNKVI